MKYLILLILIFNIQTAFSDDDGGKLDDLEKPEKKDSPATDAPDSDDDDFFGDEFGEQVLMQIAFELIAYSPQLLFGSSTTFNYSLYPYQGFSDGIYEEFSRKKFAGNIELNYGLESPGLQSINLESSFYLGKYVSVDASIFNYLENVNGKISGLTVSDAFLNFNRIRRQTFVLRWGLGIKTLWGDLVNSGFAYQIGFLAYPGDPISFSINYDGSIIGDTYYNGFETQINYHLDRYNFFIGYDHFGNYITSINQLKLGTGFSF